MDIKIIRVKDQKEGSEKALGLLKSTVDNRTLLLLSGGTSPDQLYKLIAQDSNIIPGAVAMVDERYVTRMHNNSNEKMIVETGLAEYFVQNGIPFYPILEDEIDPEQTALDYEKTLKELFAKFPKKVAVMGIGADGHTSGIKPGLEYDHARWVVAYDDKDGTFGKRITTTFEALEQINEFIVLVFGESKKEALNQVLSGIDQNIMPAGFFSQINCSIFTDIQSVA